MNGNELMDVLGEIDESLLLECEEYTAQVVRRRKIMTRTAAGICAVLALTVGIRMLPVFDRGQDYAADTTVQMQTEAAILQSQNTDSGTEHSMNTPTYSYAETVDDAADITVTAGDSYTFTTEFLPDAEENGLTADAAPKKDLAAEEEVEWEELPEVDAPAEEPSDIPAVEPVCDEPAADAMDKTGAVVTESTAAALPILPVEEIKGDFGFEGILLYEDDVHCNDNLLDLYGTPDTLPVYKNLAFYDMSGRPVYLDDDVMYEMGKTYADLLGFEVLSYSTEYAHLYDPENIPGDIVRLETTGGEIRVQGNGLCTIDFADPIPLTGGGKLNGETSLHAAEKTAASLWKRYGMLLDGNIGQYSLTFDRNIYGEAYRRYVVFSVSDDIHQNYFNASFANLWFFPGETDDTLGGIQIQNQAGALEKIGDYPLISEEEATEMLLAGEYITTVPAEYLTDGGFTEDAILSCELEYRPSNIDTYYLPYYHYYVRLDNFPGHNMADGLENYGGYWVPAVHPDYLDTSMVWDGRFN